MSVRSGGFAECRTDHLTQNPDGTPQGCPPVPIVVPTLPECEARPTSASVEVRNADGGTSRSRRSELPCLLPLPNPAPENEGVGSIENDRKVRETTGENMSWTGLTQAPSSPRCLLFKPYIWLPIGSACTWARRFSASTRARAMSLSWARGLWQQSSHICEGERGQVG